jgi:hypothetical protein
MKIRLIRYAYMYGCTLGALMVGQDHFFTIERPWIKDDHKGGRPFSSCVPDGEYEIKPFTRPNGDDVYALVNPDLGVYLNEYDRPEGKGRYLCLLHPGNYVQDVVGCIAPGLNYKIVNDRHMVASSRMAMSRIMGSLSHQEGHILSVERTNGAKE